MYESYVCNQKLLRQTATSQDSFLCTLHFLLGRKAIYKRHLSSFKCANLPRITHNHANIVTGLISVSTVLIRKVVNIHTDEFIRQD